ncbi:unnamed protein product [Ambrosiozyma monospora]|uniref:Unnamed protein product n=1 Tax=Ambrosiozyma monospora TaxID=43982 RepID=A0ACB5U3F9_AMBMO|nr:unnamed protein product [Ambrosiozyma monospora]
MSSSNSNSRSNSSSKSSSPSPHLLRSSSSRTISATAKRSPSILVTDARKNQIKAPFAGHRLQNIQRSVHNDRHGPSPLRQQRKTNRNGGSSSSSGGPPSSQPGFAQRMLRRTAPTKYSDISISNILSNISDVPSSRRREDDPNANTRTGPRMIPHRLCSTAETG